MVIDPEPGEVVTWPQMTPHRVENLEGLNVSLSTEHMNPRAVRRSAIHRANHYLRTSIGISPSSTAVEGPFAWAKQKFARVWSLARTGRSRKKAYTYPVSFKLDPGAPNGYVLIENIDPGATARHLEKNAA